jgi:peptidoglycan/LPS O-acetylase OafA/YrhL
VLDSIKKERFSINVANSRNQPSITSGFAISYRPDIDGLRAVAILFVVLFHAFPEYPTGGYVGVDIFFVISGYLITDILIRDLRTGRFSILTFYARRCRRIVPALALVMATTLAAGYVLLLSDEYAEAGLEVAGGAGFISNVLFWQQTGYFDAPAATKPLLHLWSLGIEEQYYLIWPFLLWACYKFRLKTGIVILGLMAASFFVMCLWTGPSAFYLLPSRFWELLLGGALAWWGQSHAEDADNTSSRFPAIIGLGRLPSIRNAASYVAAGLLVWCLFFLRADPDYPDINALAPTLAGFLLIATGGQAWISTVLASQPFVFIGRISYPLYLWHWPLLSFAHIIVGGIPPIETRIGLVILAFLLATLTWLLIERPVQAVFSNQRIASRKHVIVWAIGPSVSLLVAIGGSGFAIERAGGIPSHHRRAGVSPTDYHRSQFARLVDQMRLRRDTCGPDIAGCWMNNPAKATFALYGDSHAYQYTPSLLDPATDQDGWLLIARAGCPPVLNIDVRNFGENIDCAAQNAMAQDVLKRRVDVTTVLLSSLTTPYFEIRKPADSAPQWAFRLQTTHYKGNTADIYFQGLRDSVASLLLAGKRVILMIDNPELDFHADRCLGRRRLERFLARAEPQCTVSRQYYLDRSAAYREMTVRLQAEFPSILVYDPVDTFCDLRDCPVMRDGHSLFSDNSHLSEYGSRLAGAHLLEWMAGQGIPISEQVRAYAALLLQKGQGRDPGH